jgi:hypothetical protein
VQSNPTGLLLEARKPEPGEYYAAFHKGDITFIKEGKVNVLMFAEYLNKEGVAEPGQHGYGCWIKGRDFHKNYLYCVMTKLND